MDGSTKTVRRPWRLIFTVLPWSFLEFLPGPVSRQLSWTLSRWFVRRFISDIPECTPRTAICEQYAIWLSGKAVPAQLSRYRYVVCRDTYVISGIDFGDVTYVGFTESPEKDTNVRNKCRNKWVIIGAQKLLLSIP